MLGKSVTVVIDRPIGSRHPRYHKLIYPINYGYVPGTVGGDGEPLDAYLMGVEQPTREYSGKVIGIVRRLNDREDKLIVAPEGMCFHQAEMEAAVQFQERYFRTRIIPLYHRSCGAIIYKRERDRILYLLVYQRGSHTWSFPKGHMEKYETEEMTALREVQEEVNMKIQLRKGFRGEATYAVGAGEKTVVLFLAKSTNPPVLSAQEVLASKWCTLQEARKILHTSYIEVLQDAEAFLLQSPAHKSISER